MFKYKVALHRCSSTKDNVTQLPFKRLQWKLDITVRYNKMPDIAKQIFGLVQSPSLCDLKFVGYSEVGFNIMPIIAKQFFRPN